MTLSFDQPAPSINRVILDGRLDIVGANEIELRLSTWATAQTSPVLMDMDNVTFISSMGIRVLLSTAQALRRKGVYCGLVSPQPLVREVLDLAGLHETLPMHADLESAMAACKPQ